MRKMCVCALAALLTFGSVSSAVITSASAAGPKNKAAVCVEDKKSGKEAEKQEKAEKKAAKEAEKEQKKAEKNAAKEEKKAAKQAEKDAKHGNTPDVPQENPECPEWYETAKRICQERRNADMPGMLYYCEGIVDPLSFYADYDPLIFGGECFSISVGAYTAKYLSITMDPRSELCSINIDFTYSDYTRYAVDDTVALSDMEYYIRNLDTVFWNGQLDTSALGLHDLRGDAELLIARLLYMSDEALEGTGFRLSDSGIVFSEDYSNVDVFRCFSDEKPLVNDHFFENGVCADCGLSWTEYVHDAMAQLNGNNDDYQFIYGADGPYMLSLGDYVSFTSDPFCLALYYRHFREDEAGSNLNILFYEDYVEFIYEKEDDFYYIGEGIVTSATRSILSISCDKENYADVFASKDALMAASGYVLFLDDTYSEDDTDAPAGHSKADMVDSLLAEYDSYMKSIDYALSTINTNLGESGLVY